MKLEDILAADLVVVSEGASLEQAAALMRARRTDVLAVQQDERIVGTLSQRDLALKGYAEGRDPHETATATVMTLRVVTCPLEADLPAALRLADEQGVDALLVRARSGELIGLVTRLQLLEGLAEPDILPRGPLPEQVRRVRGNPV
jgi:CBS domain-containing protein